MIGGKNARLAKKGQTNKSRYEEKERYRAVEKRLTLAITAVFIALVIVLLFNILYLGVNALKLGIIAAMEPEVRSLVESLENQRTQEVANQLIYEGTIAGKEVVLIQSGIGKVNATIATTLLIERLGVTHVINTGSAGGIGTHLAVGDLVVSTQLAYHDADARAFDYAYGQVPAHATLLSG